MAALTEYLDRPRRVADKQIVGVVGGDGEGRQLGGGERADETEQDPVHVSVERAVEAKAAPAPDGGHLGRHLVLRADD